MADKLPKSREIGFLGFVLLLGSRATQTGDAIGTVESLETVAKKSMEVSVGIRSQVSRTILLNF